MPGWRFGCYDARLCGVNVKLTMSFVVLDEAGSVCVLQVSQLFSRGSATDTQVAKNSSVIARGGVGNARTTRSRPAD